LDGRRRADELEQARAARIVAGPLIHRHAFVRAGRLIDSRRHHLLWHHVPRALRSVHPIEQPPLLCRSEDRRLRIGGARTRRLRSVRAWLVGAELPRVEHEERGELPVGELSIELHRRAGRSRSPPQRHVLVVGLVGRGAPGEKDVPRVVPFGDLTCPVVVDFVIVGRQDPGKRRVRRLQIRVEVVLRVPIAIVLEGGQFDALMLPHLVSRPGPS